MKFTFWEIFTDYSEDALNQVIEQAPGKPCNDDNGNQIGIIVKATRVESSNTIEFEVEAV